MRWVAKLPSKSRVLEYWSKKGYWVFHPRYKGTWESSGTFLDHDPTEDIIEVAEVIRTGIVTNAYDGVDFTPRVTTVIVVGASFGGAVALLSSLHDEVDKVIAISPVIDWVAELKNTVEPLPWFRSFVQNGFGEAYRFADSDFDQLGNNPKFFNPMSHLGEYNPKKLFIMHAKDDILVSLSAVERFIQTVGCKNVINKQGGHLSSSISTHFFVGRSIRRFISS